MMSMGLQRGSCGCQPRCNGKVYALQEETSGEDEACCVSHNHKTCARKSGQHSPAAFRNHMRRILQRHAIAHERSNSGMLLKLVEQFVSPHFFLGKRSDLYHDANRERITIGVEESAALDFTSSKAYVFIGHTFIAIEVEPFLDSMGVETQHLFDAQRHFIGPELVLQSSFLRKKRIGPIGSDDDWSKEVAILATTAHTDDLRIFVKQIINNGGGNKECTCFFSFTG